MIDLPWLTPAKGIIQESDYVVPKVLLKNKIEENDDAQAVEERVEGKTREELLCENIGIRCAAARGVLPEP